MRWILLILLLLLAAWQLMPEPEPVPVEETVIGAPIGVLREAEGLDARQLEQAEERKRRMEEALGGDG